MGEFAIIALAAFCGWRCVQQYRAERLTFVFWAANAYFLFLVASLLASLIAADLLDTNVFFRLDTFQPIDFAFLCLRCIAGFLAAERLVEHFTKQDPVASAAPTNSLLRFLSPLLAGLGLVAIPLGAGTSYESFVSGESIGWGVTLLGLAVAGAALSISVNKKPIVFLSVAIVVLAGFVLAIQSSVRTLVALPILGLLVQISLVVKRRSGRIKHARLMAMAMAGAALFLLVSDERFGEISVPEAFTVGVGLAIFQTGSYGQTPVGDPAVLRLLGGLVAYPAHEAGLALSLEDAATSFASDVMGSWVTPWAHFPSTWFMDLLATSSSDPIVDSFFLGLVITFLSRLVTRMGRIGALFVPSIVMLQVLVARGAIWTGSTSTSAVLLFLTMISLGYFFLRATGRQRS